jgi:hypothetical protein
MIFPLEEFTCSDIKPWLSVALLLTLLNNNTGMSRRSFDPIENTAIDIHEYLDSDFSGSHVVCSRNASYNLDGLTCWLRKHHLKVRTYDSDVSE